jgi:Ran GTPase-activating protein (RanGAP) involved in mRNA processing and transport
VTLSPTEINMRDTQFIGLKEALLIQYAIGQNPEGKCLATSLVLAKNAMGKEAAKVLTVGLQFNKSLINLDLSHCNFGSSGVTSLCTSLAQNFTLKSLNLYRNICDVNGARAIGECLKKNSSLEFLDIGHNRIRQTGLKAICDGIIANPKSKMTQLGVRANFINDDGFTYLFETLVFPKTGAHLTQIFLKANFLSEHHKIALAQQALSTKCFVDDF